MLLSSRQNDSANRVESVVCTKLGEAERMTRGSITRSFRLLWLVFALSSIERADALSPQEALKRMKVADGFEVKLFASEPDIRQPLTMTFDERGRMWVVQYLQYPV